MKRAIGFSLLVLLCACKKEDFDIHNLNGDRIISQGHGGMGIYYTYPLDSPASILMCLNSGADGSEMDVQMTRDSVLVAYHASDLSEATDMSGLVIEHSWAEIAQAHFTGVPYTDHHILRIEDLFSHLDDPRAHICTFDIKLHVDGLPDERYMDRFAEAIIRLLDRFNVTDKVHLESQHIYMLAALKVRRPELKLFYYPTSFDEGLATAAGMGLLGLTTDIHLINSDQVATAHAHHLWVALWNVKTKEENREAIRMNPEIIQSDRVDHLVGLLD